MRAQRVTTASNGYIEKITGTYNIYYLYNNGGDLVNKSINYSELYEQLKFDKI